MRIPAILIAAFVAIVALPTVQARAADPICGDVNTSGTVTTADALSVLKRAVGQPVALQCPAAATPLESGQSQCFNEGGDVIDCAGTGQDAALKKGVPATYTDNGNGTITDQTTGLTWEKLSEDGSIHDEGNVYTWSEALDRVDTLNTQSFAGHNDWRLPNIVEARTLLNFDTYSPAVAAEFDSNCETGCTVLTCNCIQPDWYWTSTTYQETNEDAWFVDMYNGYTDSTTKTEQNFARAVRGGL